MPVKLTTPLSEVMYCTPLLGSDALPPPEMDIVPVQF
jgi:hypothetical protein